MALKEGEKWAITWREGDSEDGFEFTKPRGIDDLANTPPQVRFLAAISVLMRDPEFIEQIMKWFERDYEKWEEKHKKGMN